MYKENFALNDLQWSTIVGHLMPKNPTQPFNAKNPTQPL